MQKISTPVSHTEVKVENELQPKDDTLRNILRFASTYRSVKSNENHTIGFNLN